MMPENNVDNLPGGIRLIRGIYWFLVIGGPLTILGKLAGFPSVQKYSTAVIAFNTLLDVAILLGIYKKKAWLVPFVLLYAYLNVLGRLALVVLPRASNIKMMEAKVVHVAFAVFCIYLIVVFSRKETKLYYGDKGQTII